MTLRNVLFAGTANASCSIMAEAYMNLAGRGLYRAFSAGNAPVGAVNPLAIETLRNVGIRCHELSSKSWALFTMPVSPRMDVIVFLGAHVASGAKRYWPGMPLMHRWNLDDPNNVGGSGARRTAAYRDCFAQLRQKIDALVLADPSFDRPMEHAARGVVPAVGNGTFRADVHGSPLPHSGPELFRAKAHG